MVTKIVLTAEDIVEITNKMNNEFQGKNKPTQGYLEYLMCKVIRDYKGIDFFKEEPIKGPDEDVNEKDDKKYRKIGKYEKIAKGAMQSWNNGILTPIWMPRTIGDIPAHYANERDFYNPI